MFPGSGCLPGTVVALGKGVVDPCVVGRALVDLLGVCMGCSLAPVQSCIGVGDWLADPVLVLFVGRGLSRTVSTRWVIDLHLLGCGEARCEYLLPCLL